MLPGATQVLDMTARVPPDLVYNAGAPFGITATAKVEDLAGIEVQPADNTVSTTVTAVAVANLAVRDLAVQRPPLRMRTGEPAVVHLQSTISSGGPSSPMDARTNLTAKADAGASVTPTWLEVPSDRAVIDGETADHRRLADHHLSGARPAPLRLRAGDHAPSRARHRSGRVERPLRHDARSRVHRARAGRGELDARRLSEPRRPEFARDAAGHPLDPGWGICPEQRLRRAWIDPGSIRVGSRRMVQGGEPGGTRFSEPRLEDAPERTPPETTLDGDEDLFVDTIDLAEAGLRADDTEACVMGTFTDPATGERVEFYGCDSILVRR